MNIKYFDHVYSFYYPLWFPLLLPLVPLCFPNSRQVEAFSLESLLCKEEQIASFAKRKNWGRFSSVSLQVLCRPSLGIMGLEKCPCLVQVSPD